MKKTRSVGTKNPHGVYQQMLLDKRERVMAGLGIKFDTIAKMGRVAEEDQAQMSHDEFVSLHLNSLDYVQLRLIEEALDRIESGDYGVCLACEEAIVIVWPTCSIEIWSGDLRRFVIRCRSFKGGFRALRAITRGSS